MSTQTHLAAKGSKMFYGPGEWGGAQEAQGSLGAGLLYGCTGAFRRAWGLASCSLVTLLKIHNNF